MPRVNIGYHHKQGLASGDYQLVDEFLNCVHSFVGPASLLFTQECSSDKDVITLGFAKTLILTLKTSKILVSQLNSIKILHNSEKVTIKNLTPKTELPKDTLDQAIKGLKHLKGISYYANSNIAKKVRYNRYYSRNDYSPFRLMIIILSIVCCLISLTGREEVKRSYYAKKTTEYIYSYVLKYEYSRSILIPSVYDDYGVLPVDFVSFYNFLFVFVLYIESSTNNDVNSRDIIIGKNTYYQFGQTSKINDLQYAYKLHSNKNRVLNKSFVYNYDTILENNTHVYNSSVFLPTNKEACPLPTLHNGNYSFSIKTLQGNYDIYGVNVNAFNFTFYSADMHLGYIHNLLDENTLGSLSSMLVFYSYYIPEIDKFAFASAIMENTFTGIIQYHLAKARIFDVGFYEKESDVNRLAVDIVILLLQIIDTLLLFSSSTHQLKRVFSFFKTRAKIQAADPSDFDFKNPRSKQYIADDFGIKNTTRSMLKAPNKTLYFHPNADAHKNYVKQHPHPPHQLPVLDVIITSVSLLLMLTYFGFSYYVNKKSNEAFFLTKKTNLTDIADAYDYMRRVLYAHMVCCILLLFKWLNVSLALYQFIYPLKKMIYITLASLLAITFCYVGMAMIAYCWVGGNSILLSFDQCVVAMLSMFISIGDKMLISDYEVRFFNCECSVLLQLIEICCLVLYVFLLCTSIAIFIEGSRLSSMMSESIKMYIGNKGEHHVGAMISAKGWLCVGMSTSLSKLWTKN